MEYGSIPKLLPNACVQIRSESIRTACMSFFHASGLIDSHSCWAAKMNISEQLGLHNAMCHKVVLDHFMLMTLPTDCAVDSSVTAAIRIGLAAVRWMTVRLGRDAVVTIDSRWRLGPVV